MNQNKLKLIKFIFLIYTLFISFSYADLPKIKGIFPNKGTDENGHFSILGSNLKEIKQVLFQTNEGIVSVPQIVIFNNLIKVYFVPKNALISTISVVGSFGILNTDITFLPETPAIEKILYSYDKEGKNYLIVMGRNLNFIENCHFITKTNSVSTSPFIYFGAFGQVYIPQNAKNGLISISGNSFKTKKTEINFIDNSAHIPENIENNEIDYFSTSNLSNDFMIYPNPSSGSFMIYGNQIKEINDIKIIDFLGNNISFIYQNNELKITKSGVYFIHIHGKKIKAIVY
ncbi:MAG: T9SS C-terminal target domain-containing protein [Cytophagales bacterium]|nr:MAG: T9SS C-terminal target domain-containing protein [Cytophagales bacterium]